MKKTLILLLITLISANYVAAQSTINEIVIKKDGGFEDKFLINSNKVGFWITSTDKFNESHLDSTKFKYKKPIMGEIMKLNDSVFGCVSINKYNYITKDFGKTWVSQFYNPVLKSTSCQYLNESTFFAVDQSSNLIMTKNKGITWDTIFTHKNLVVNPFMNVVPPANLYVTNTTDVYFINENKGFISLRYTVYLKDKGIKTVYGLYMTDNRGKTWTKCNIEPYDMWKITTDCNGNLFLLSLTGDMYNSNDGGKVWNKYKTLDISKLNYKHYADGVNIDPNTYYPFVFYRIY